MLVPSSLWQPNSSTRKCRWKTTVWVGVPAGGGLEAVCRGGHVLLPEGRGPPAGMDRIR